MFDTVDMLTVHRNGKRHLEGETFNAGVSVASINGWFKSFFSCIAFEFEHKCPVSGH